MEANHSEMGPHSEEEISELKGKMSVMESKMDEMMRLLASVLKEKGLAQDPNPLTGNEEGVGQALPAIPETRQAVAADAAHTRLKA